jgi:hypothetical protein
MRTSTIRSKGKTNTRVGANIEVMRPPIERVQVDVVVMRADGERPPIGRELDIADPLLGVLGLRQHGPLPVLVREHLHRPVHLHTSSQALEVRGGFAHGTPSRVLLLT